jgi:hypothetical protein
MTTTIPDGYYAVPDPRNTDVITLWRAANGKVTTSPVGAKYGPVLLNSAIPAHLYGPARKRFIYNWFNTVQQPWNAAILATIAADPEAAGALYARTAIRCRDCGRRLTDKVSKADGRGPDCSGRRAAA